MATSRLFTSRITSPITSLKNFARKLHPSLLKLNIFIAALLLMTAKASADCLPDPEKMNAVEEFCTEFDEFVRELWREFPPDCSHPPNAGIALSAAPELISQGEYSAYVCAIKTCAAGPVHTAAYVFGGPQCEGPNENSPNRRNTTDRQRSQTCSGSIIQVDNHVLGEMVPVVGTSFDLAYFSNRVIGRSADYKVPLPMQGPTPDMSTRVRIWDKNQNPISDTTYTASSPGTSMFIWNGLDQNSQPTWGMENFFFRLDSTVGTSISTSEFVLSVGNFKAKNLGLGGWAPDVYHFYDANAKVVFRGDGTIRPVEALSLPGGGFRLANEDGSEVYEFDPSGRHVLTRLGVTGGVIYRFAYESSSRLSQIIEPGPRVTSFQYGANGLSSIVSPYGKVTNVQLNSDGYLARLTNPKGDVHEMSYHDAGGLLAMFKTPTGLTSRFIYNSDGHLRIDQNTGCALAELSEPDFSNPNFAVHTLTTKLGRITRVVNEDTDSTKSRTVTFPSGLKTVLIEGETSEIYNDGFVDYVLNWADDPRFGAMSRNITSRTGDPSGATRSTQISNSAVLTDASDPFSIVSLTTTEQIGAKSTITTYDGATKTYSTVTGLGRTSRVKINNLEQPVEIAVGEFTPLSLAYDSEARLTSVTHGSRETKLTYSPANGLLSSVTNPFGQKTQYTYDGADRLITQMAADGRAVHFTYDGSGHLTSITPAGRPVHEFTYGANDLVSSYSPPLLSGVPNISTTFSYNHDKQLTSVKRPDGKEVRYEYDGARGLISGLFTPDGAYSNFQYDQSGRLVQLRTPHGVQNQYEYSGSLLSKTVTIDSARGRTLTYAKTFDASSGLLNADQVSFGAQSLSVSYSYDNDEFLVGAGALALDFDTPNGSLLGSTLSHVQDSWEYNSFGEALGYSALAGDSADGGASGAFGGVAANSFGSSDLDPDARPIYDLTVERDALGRIVKKRESFADLRRFHRHGYACDDHDWDRFFYKFNFFEFHKARFLKAKHAKWHRFYKGHSHDDDRRNGRHGKHHDNHHHDLYAVSFDYTYDSVGRLILVKHNRREISKYIYDDNGNRVGGHVRGKKIKAKYDNQDRLLQYGAYHYSYNANGDLESKSNSHTHEKVKFSYDVFGSLKEVELSRKHKISYVTDAENRRIARLLNGKVHAHYIYNELNQIVGDVDSRGKLRRYVYGSKSNIPDYYIADGKHYRIISDHLGSPRSVVRTDTGDVIYVMLHNEFGQVLRDTHPGFLPFGFAGGLYDPDTGLVRFGARDYDAEVGRWTSKDPILFNGGDTNLYGYTFSDPINFIDPTGKISDQCLSDAIGIGSTVSGMVTASVCFYTPYGSPAFFACLAAAGGAGLGAGIAAGFSCPPPPPSPSGEPPRGVGGKSNDPAPGSMCR